MKYVGLSECTADQIRRAHAIVPITALEIEWSLWSRENEVSQYPYTPYLIQYPVFHRSLKSVAVASQPSVIF